MDTPAGSNLLDDGPKELYQVVQQANTNVGNAALFGSDKTYVLGGGGNTGAGNLEQQPNTGGMASTSGMASTDDGMLSEMQRKRKLKADKEKDARKKKSDFKF